MPDALSATDANRRPVIWTVSVTRLARLFREVSPEFDERAQTEAINLGFEDALEEIRRRLRTQRCDAVIAAGSNGAYLKSRLPVPVVLVKPTGFELMSALSRARRMAERVAVVTYQAEHAEFSDFVTSYGLSIEQRSFVTSEDALDAVSELSALGVQAIVGTGMVADFADAAGLRGVLLYSASSARAAFETALEITTATRTLGSRLAEQSRNASGSRRRRGGMAQPQMLGDSETIESIRVRAEHFARTDANVLVCGETGTGKELVARLLHERSDRSRGPLVTVNCGAFAESLFEAELFGHEEGAFTGARRGGRMGLIESAHRGTLFLDEIGELPLALQSRLLRVLEGREVLRVGANRPLSVDVRIVAATNRDLPAMVEGGGFRQDLYYRLNVLRLELPPLRQRSADIALLAGHFLGEVGRDAAIVLTADGLKLLQRYPWPGNVRELRNVLERAYYHGLAVGPGGMITRQVLLDCAPELGAEQPPIVATRGAAASTENRPSARDLQAVLNRVGGHRGRAAQQLGVSRSTLWRWLRDEPAAQNVPGDTAASRTSSAGW